MESLGAPNGDMNVQDMSSAAYASFREGDTKAVGAVRSSVFLCGLATKLHLCQLYRLSTLYFTLVVS